MVEQAAEDYAKIIQSADLEKEINPLCNNIDDMLARLDEFETVLASVRAESNGIMANHVCSILSFSANFDELRQRIDKLDTFVAAVNENLNEVEKSVDVAEQELNVTDYSIKGLLLKPLKARLSTAETSSATPKTNLIDGEFQAVPIFKADEYFGTRAEEANISDSI
ncbi:biogenesis of lysosome-related organelles complex 1 subunit 4 [Drosophila mojavensis]|uniref:Biogenesis of lysosome-related organelles complex 1 subunit 4 n=1 Tax=Drosophila mojavensis TaxID=7230 RepID=B4KWB3_DROMO|nr:biogenesis of lysosome-related organelles complex 1 subunit 4 [Drosophila mojavensis]EDW18520.1 uncharacterized protein Dmoj_GI13289 [Drosophila mojavensis]